MGAKRRSNLNNNKGIIPLNDNQKEYLNSIRNNPLTIAIGAPGTGKTMLAVTEAVAAYDNGECNRIIISRPAVPSEKLGFLPGTFKEKLDPYLRPIFDALWYYWKPEKVSRMIEIDAIEIAPIAFMKGRAQPLDTLIPTPYGYKKLKDIKVNDKVFGSNGKPIKVTGVYPQGIKKVVKIIFQDGSHTLCCEDHLWNTKTIYEKRYNKDFSTKSTKNIRKKIKQANGIRNHEIPIISNPIEFNHNDVIIHPYLLGCLLGDGSFSTGTISFTTADEQLVNNITNVLPKNYKIQKNNGSKTGYDYYITKTNTDNSNLNIIKQELKRLKLYGKTAKDKFIPDIYKFNSIENRLAIFQGLIDTDGCIYKRTNRNSCSIEFYNISEQLVDDVKFLAESLGAISFKKHRKKETLNGSYAHNNDIYSISINFPDDIIPSKLDRKIEKFINPSRRMRLIDSIEDYGELECQCISVDAINQLYLTDNFIVTHNTFSNAFIILDEAQDTTISQMRLFLTRLGTDIKCVITGDPGQTELKEKNGLQWAEEKLQYSKIVGTIYFDKSEIVRSELVKELMKHIEEEY